ncbi:MAG: hypothetical protein JSS51_09955 [Planctomycetes bacterium]|nr:hypothetical protein [Planctomycetota bacterium]
MSETLQRTKASPKWLGKQMIFILLVAGFGIWALADAMFVYPSRGVQAAEFLKLQYLKAAQEPGVLEKISVENPQAELQSLLERQATTTLTPVQKARLDWLEALRNASRLDAERTRITDPRAASDVLAKKFSNASQAPKALSRFDIPVQWGIAALCGALTAAMVFVLFRTVGTVYQYDTATKTLTLPSGATIKATDVALFDKRKWDKFLIYLKLRDDAPQMAAKEICLDLLRHSPLEDWILDMEATAFPPAPEPTDGSASPSAMLMTQPSLELPKP